LLYNYLSYYLVYFSHRHRHPYAIHPIRAITAPKARIPRARNTGKNVINAITHHAIGITASPVNFNTNSIIPVTRNGLNGKLILKLLFVFIMFVKMVDPARIELDSWDYESPASTTKLQRPFIPSYVIIYR
jgi:hypothetical protein